MAPPQRPFPVSELEQRIHTHSVNLKDKSRKLPKDFNLKDCELFELIQYSCTTMQQQMENAVKSANGSTQMECFPFVRLFRRCKHQDQVFHVETTAWEGQHAWEPKITSTTTKPEEKSNQNAFAEYGSYFGTSK